MGKKLSTGKDPVNRNYKDTVFRMLFKDRARLLGLYNAVSGRNYTDPEKLEIVTLENAVYMGMKNDIAFLIDLNLYLFEHQSTINKNMPLRFLQYVSMVRLYAESMSIEEAVDRAVEECIRQGILKDFLLQNRAEVKRMSIYEYDDVAVKQALKEDAFEAGKIEGKIEAILLLLEASGPVTEKLRKQIMGETDIKTLNRWLKMAAKVKNVDEFMKTC